jgi:putative ABC transport system permease protein
MIWRLAFRYARKEARRTRLLSLLLAFAAFFLVVGASLVSSLDANIARGLREGFVGDLEVFDASNPPTDITEEVPSDFVPIARVEQTERVILDDPDVRAASLRLAATGLLMADPLEAPVVVFGIDPAREAEVCRSPDVDAARRTLGRGKIILGSGIAERLERRPGDEVTLLLPTPDGLFEGDVLEVSSVRASGALPVIGEFIAFMPIEDLQELLGMRGQAGRIVVSLVPGADVSQVRHRLERAFDVRGLQLRVRTWRETAGPLLDIGRVGMLGVTVANVLLLLMIGLGITNTVLMLVLERTRDVGTMMALGTNRALIVGAIVAEISIVCTLAAAAGVLVGGVACGALGQLGFPAWTGSMALAFGGERFYPVLRLSHALLGFVTVAGVGPLAALFPAVHASRLDPAEALRSA